MLTPAISVISAVEGLGVVSAAFQPYIVWIALAILIGLFAIQRTRHGARRQNVRPGHAGLFRGDRGDGRESHPRPSAGHSGAQPGLHLGLLRCPSGLFVPVAGRGDLRGDRHEALYADMGHFGRKPITRRVAVPRRPGADAQLHGPGGNADRASGISSTIRSSTWSPPVADHPAAGHRDTGDDHRQPGGHLRRLLGHAAGGPARFHAADADHAHLVDRKRANLRARPSTGLLAAMVALLVVSSAARRRCSRPMGWRWSGRC